ncbi:hypothetical protein P4O66_018459 [Electrophorus voltai]|uniref:Uncharacterized protein n=1 Tax=Electrophorus voltai TaxID=2609070 RepID=A0AAD9DMB6_9TELE|nr:hypothetical protein P4O66_018459 [Electrophorus voltai]
MSAGSNSFCSVPDNRKRSASFHLCHHQQFLVFWICAYCIQNHQGGTNPQEGHA